MLLKGRAHKFGDDINTDYIISGKYKFKTLDLKELAKHIMEDICPDFYKNLKPGDFMVAGSNFGCGSSREQAPLAVKHAGVGAVLAKSFARIFFRNAVNIGLPLLECETDKIKQGDALEIDLKKGIIFDKTRNVILRAHPLPEIMLRIFNAGGLANYLRKHGSF
ncbi:3-isopropylmalate dehydratase [Candidatus Desantisbacteria bacterium CG_4_10_14_0_8_um_filter_48_22]|uniref:3-isopropylmalate dehydratase small subunit n=1 Tax=Candidatus Desantisbacteria bacterium CG_4_10_14_0_8_um_filter_48_22 TaxID=1974543 RepID=A0A2M7SA29_9BACT|nr:MAG: 3-isopropylmalate dehydratase [Candidatus Desantisbacteria bacterium CG1_02_49_89]PIV56383.1 MAG: 3-isopropylmalate dehydratase [Candidatus Desantisbacteria bacterium CG02_land_8_20_14_3_00_49_13]PIZ16319.1 MAG: 3-isopropylmalate dehydratase [Candidatus Desantisbacteria bacterium CG_4_10_14_0_8_um_filter_48_22]